MAAGCAPKLVGLSCWCASCDMPNTDNLRHMITKTERRPSQTDLHTHCFNTLSQSLSAVVCIVGQQENLYLRQTLSIPCRTDPYSPVVTVIRAFSRLLLDVGFPNAETIVLLEALLMGKSALQCCAIAVYPKCSTLFWQDPNASKAWICCSRPN